MDNTKKPGEGEVIYLKNVANVALHSSLVAENIFAVITKLSIRVESCYDVLPDVDFESFVGCKLLSTQAACHIVRVLYQVTNLSASSRLDPVRPV